MFFANPDALEPELEAFQLRSIFPECFVRILMLWSRELEAFQLRSIFAEYVSQNAEEVWQVFGAFYLR